jgi:hypothetical protein
MTTVGAVISHSHPAVTGKPLLRLRAEGLIELAATLLLFHGCNARSHSPDRGRGEKDGRMGNTGRRRRRIEVAPSEPVTVSERAPAPAPEQPEPDRVPEPSR